MEHSTFTPLVFSATGEMARQSTTFLQRVATLLADKWDHLYNSTLNLHSFSVLCNRGNGQAIYYFFTKGCHPTSRQMGSPVQLNTMLVTLQYFFLTTSFSHKMHSRCSILPWPPHQVLFSLRPSPQQGTHLCYLPSPFFLFCIFAFLYSAVHTCVL